MRPITITQEYLTELREQAIASIAQQMDTTFANLATQRNSTNAPSIKFEQKLDIERKMEVPIQVNYTGTAYVKQLALLQNCTSEIAWHGTVTANEDRSVFTIQNILVYPQSVTGTTVDTDETKYQQWKQLLNDDEYNSLRFQAHSHVNMGVTPSGVDRNLYDSMLQSLSNNSFYIFMILNKKTDAHIEIYDLQNNAFYGNSDVVVTVEGIRIKQWYDAQYQAHVTAPAPVTTYPSYQTPAYNSKANKDVYDRRTDWQKFMDGDGPNPYSSRKDTKIITNIADEVDDLTGAYPSAMALAAGTATTKRGPGRPPKDKDKKGGKK